VPVRQDPDLVEVLSRLDLDQDLPPELCLVAAEVLAFVQEANQAWLEAENAPAPG
jgi:flagellar biosynthesis protein